jgi:hypothetical protein
MKVPRQFLEENLTAPNSREQFTVVDLAGRTAATKPPWHVARGARKKRWAAARAQAGIVRAHVNQRMAPDVSDGWGKFADQGDHNETIDVPDCGRLFAGQPRGLQRPRTAACRRCAASFVPDA